MNQTLHNEPVASATTASTNALGANRREGNVMRKRNLKRVALATTVVAGLAGGGLVAGAATFATRYTSTAGQDLSTGVTPPVWPKLTQTCTADCTVALEAVASDVTVQDAVNGPQTVPVWGFRLNGSAADHGDLLAGPLSAIKVPVGTKLTITLTNHLPATAGPLSLSFPSIDAADVSGAEAAPGGTATYTVTASKVGTSMYEAGPTTVGPRQVAMGLVGAFVVTPNAAACPSTMCAFDGTAYQDEAIVAAGTLDAEFANDPYGFDMAYYGQSTTPAATPRKVYHLIDGKSFPDTDLIDARQGDHVLLRYVNAGVKDSSLGLLGLHQELLGRNADPYVHPQTFVAPLIGPGETADVAVAVPTVAKIGMRYPLTDQSNRTGTQTLTGFGGAMTFLNVWGGAAPVVTVLAGPTVGGLKVSTTTGALSGVAAPSGSLTVAAVEYFLGTTDPGAGSGVAVTPAGPLFAATLAALPVSGDVVNVRAKDSAGTWGAVSTVTAVAAPKIAALAATATTFAGTVSATSPATLVSAEYYVGAVDPGVGSGTPLTVGSGGAFTASIAAVAGDTVTVRATDSLGQVSTGSTTVQ